MDINIFKILTGFALICVSNISLAEFNNNLMVKSGIFTLKYTDQTIQEPVTYVPDSKNFFAIEFEWKRVEKNISPGIEFIKFKNDYAATTDDDMASYLLFFNLRKYIGKMKRVQPFVGAGF